MVALDCCASVINYIPPISRHIHLGAKIISRWSSNRTRPSYSSMCCFPITRVARPFACALGTISVGSNIHLNNFEAIRALVRGTRACFGWLRVGSFFAPEPPASSPPASPSSLSSSPRKLGTPSPKLSNQNSGIPVFGFMRFMALPMLSISSGTFCSAAMRPNASRNSGVCSWRGITNSPRAR